MAKPTPKHLGTLIKKIPQHAEALDSSADVPISHYARLANDSWNLFIYAERNLARAGTVAVARERHLRHLARTTLLGLVEAFERFLKEIAAVCVDEVAPLVLDDRLDELSAKPAALPKHFAASSLGRALCEASVWLKCKDVNDRFRAILADPFKPGTFYAFPKASQGPAALRDVEETMSLLFQLRHTLVHNAGVVTQSDAQTMRLLVEDNVEAPRLLAPTHNDVWYVKLFLDQVAQLLNEQISKRLAELLTTIDTDKPGLIVGADRAQALADRFKVSVTVSGVTRTPT